MFTRAAIIPTINRVTPATVGRGTTTAVTIVGTYFLPETKVLIVAPGVTANQVSVNGESKLTVQISVAGDATIGPADIWVVVPGTGAGPNVGAADVCHCLDVTG